MREGRRGTVWWVFGAFVCVCLAAALQQSALMRWSLAGALPAPVALAALVAALRMHPGPAAIFGGAAGIVEGALAGADLTALVVSRALACFVVAWPPELGFVVRPSSAGLLVLVGTFLSQGTFVVLAPPADLARALGVTIGSAIYNGVLAVVLGLVLRRAFAEEAG